MNRMLYDVILPGHPEMVAGTSNSASTTAVTSDGGSSSGGVFIPRDPQGLVGFDAVQGARVPSTMLHDHTDPYLTQVRTEVERWRGQERAVERPRT